MSTRIRHRTAPSGPAAPDRLDLIASFGPLSSVHAALDATGQGRPCATVAYFAGRTEAEVAAAIDQVLAALPILRRRMEWHGGQPMLGEPEPGPADGGLQHPPQILSFSPAQADGRIWRYGLRSGDGGVWLFAAWAHAIADGLSMLHFLQLTAAALAGRPPQAQPPQPRPPRRRQPFAAWLPGFVVNQLRPYVRMLSSPTSMPGGCWLVVPPAGRDALRGAAAAAGVRFSSWLAAAVAIAFRAQQPGRKPDRVHLNLPISHASPQAQGGFGFGAGSLLLPTRVGAADGIAEVARRIDHQLALAVRKSWDLNLLHFLGTDARRHRRYAIMQSSRRLNGSISVSWKGDIDGLGAADGVGAVACFAATPTLHASAHSDANGFSLSLTSAQEPEARTALLLDVAEALGAGRAHRVFDLRAPDWAAGGGQASAGSAR